MPLDVNSNFYNTNENRGYPIDDAATSVDDAGVFVPQDIIADIQLVFPETLGPAVYLAALTSGPHMVTAVFASTASSFMPVAAISVPTPVIPYAPYPVRPMADGVVGWIVFGRGTSQPYAGRFSTPEQSTLLTRCARPYRVPPVLSLCKPQANTPLSGLIRLEAGTDIAIDVADRVIAGHTRRAIVLSLTDALNRNVFDLYSGTCNTRPESGNCRKTPLTSIAGVTPDCDGNIDINFAGIAAAGAVGGITMTLNVGLTDVCAATTTVPSYYQDRCGSVASAGLYHSSHGV